LPNIFKRFSNFLVEPYQLPDEKDLVFEDLTDDVPDPPVAEDDAEELDLDLEAEGSEEDLEFHPEVEDIFDPEPAPTQEPEPEPEPMTQVDYAKVQADAILRNAKRQADEILAKATQDAEEKAKAVYESARQNGYREGYAQGTERALEESIRQREEQAARLETEVKQFLDRASAVLDKQLEDRTDELRDLAMAVAEKVVGISLKSSSEVICRMIQTAIDKRKRKEWVRIYIAECDAKKLTQIPPSLASALAALSDRVRIIPVADDEPGTCIIEMPDEIVDASASTQLNNLRGMLMDTTSMGASINLK
jgi:flagellar assembly protein FliH